MEVAGSGPCPPSVRFPFTPPNPAPKIPAVYQNPEYDNIPVPNPLSSHQSPNSTSTQTRKSFCNDQNQDLVSYGTQDSRPLKRKYHQQPPDNESNPNPKPSSRIHNPNQKLPDPRCFAGTPWEVRIEDAPSGSSDRGTGIVTESLPNSPRENIQSVPSATKIGKYYFKNGLPSGNRDTVGAAIEVDPTNFCKQEQVKVFIIYLHEGERDGRVSYIDKTQKNNRRWNIRREMGVYRGDSHWIAVIPDKPIELFTPTQECLEEITTPAKDQETMERLLNLAKSEKLGNITMPDNIEQDCLNLWNVMLLIMYLRGQFGDEVPMWVTGGNVPDCASNRFTALMLLAITTHYKEPIQVRMQGGFGTIYDHACRVLKDLIRKKQPRRT